MTLLILYSCMLSILLCSSNWVHIYMILMLIRVIVCIYMGTGTVMCVPSTISYQWLNCLDWCASEWMGECVFVCAIIIIDEYTNKNQIEKNRSWRANHQNIWEAYPLRGCCSQWLIKLFTIVSFSNHSIAVQHKVIGQQHVCVLERYVLTF